MCIDVRKEPIFYEVKIEDLPREAKKSREVRLDVSALNFWTTGQHAFFDVRGFCLFAQRHSKMAAEKCFRANEDEKRRNYGNRVLQIKNRFLHSPGFCCKWRYGKRMHLALQKISRDDCR